MGLQRKTYVKGQWYSADELGRWDHRPCALDRLQVSLTNDLVRPNRLPAFDLGRVTDVPSDVPTPSGVVRVTYVEPQPWRDGWRAVDGRPRRHDLRRLRQTPTERPKPKVEPLTDGLVRVDPAELRRLAGIIRMGEYE